ncbi:MAG: mannosyl-3-phosphoglycerate phosphatase [Chloroflexota bacterium]|nr:mannosyl-3-phosphoglycerate phosphatase [Chloroflexota bacterium]
MRDLEPKLVVFTDLDGTLLDRETYSYEKALPTINYLRQEGVPIIFCSAKTRAEQKVYRQKLGITDPFIVENGGAIFINQDYFSFTFDFHRIQNGYKVIELGTSYGEIRRILEQISIAIRANIRGFGDMSTEEVAAETGLSREAAHLAKQREYDETLVLKGIPQEIDSVLQAITAAGLSYSSGGRYYDVMGTNDKGVATRILINLFRKKFGQIKTVAIGDSPNDLPLLSVVETPVLVQQPGGIWEEMDLPNLYRVKGIGPEGWAKAIEEIGGAH